MRRVVILQEYIPTYRVPFYQALRTRAAEEQVDLVVACGRPSETQNLRADSGTVSFVQFFRQREVSLWGRRVVLRRVAEAIRGADLVVLEQARRNLDSYWLLGPARRRKPLVALWGHGRDYTRPTGNLDRRVRQWLTSRSDWFFAYTEGGALAIISDGYPRGQTTVVQNSIDTTALRLGVASVEPGTVTNFSHDHDLRGNTAIFLGALDESKRLDFLFEAAKITHTLNHDFRLLVAGDGALRDDVEEWARSESWITYLGTARGQAKLVALASVQVMAMPGRVGLVAVDSFAAGTPIVTTDWAWHAPEQEYLESGVNAIITPDDVREFGRELAAVLADQKLLLSLSAACLISSEQYTLEAMVENYMGGIMRALDTER
ncbi:glycosyltransferase involved in cell wall biosynthesis [Cryobacterium sp. CAN_C3]|uniref:glycosyltransferase family 4 protein n=1 Tax=unclassified Cryobacterium TaxID=2649013 RepID=UPI0018CA0033|nr:glycosyltransferase family 4 protein [Cryobacterium sp. CAN_C3]MEC5155937.1 glycosyltransferase involved in cell wall biosynthesis [Cryobacterium sp. CAN_C3]